MQALHTFYVSFCVLFLIAHTVSCGIQPPLSPEEQSPIQMNGVSPDELSAIASWPENELSYPPGFVAIVQPLPVVVYFACGDSTVNSPYEQCDDGNRDNGDGCSSICQNEICGNGVLDSGEQCDGGDINDNDGCSSSCNFEYCGDTILQTGEQCEPPSVDTCNAFCFTIACGDGFLDLVPGVEECEDNNATAGDGCYLCLLESCGNGVTNGSEGCDDGNRTSGDGCSSFCITEVCGNGIKDGTEQCDDGNTTSNDSCSSTCRFEYCGDGTTQTNEQCDDANASNADTCDNLCRIPVCGNGIIEGVEKCDDGNTVSGDGCQSNCTVVVVSETCSDGVDNDLDGQADLVDSDCKAAFVTSITVTGNILLTVTSNPETYGSCGVNLTGIQAADCICNTLAQASSVPFINDTYRNKSYFAFLSNNLIGTNAIDRLTHNGQYLNANGALIADNIADLVDADSLYSAINRNENNVSVASGNVWTGSNSSGMARTLENCGEWIVGTILSAGAIGNLATTSSSWVYAGGTSTCNNSARLYCFEH